MEKNEKKGEKLKVSKLARISFILGLFCIFLVIVQFAFLSGLISLLYVLYGSLIVLFILIPITYILAVISRLIIKKKKGEIGGERLVNFSIWSSLLSGIILILVAVAIPANSTIFRMNRLEKCKEEVQTLGLSVCRYIRTKNIIPDNLEILVKENYINSLPEPLFCESKNYLYKVEVENDMKYFVIEHPCPEKFLKGRIFSPAKRCLEIKYVQNKGLIVKTE